MDKYEMASKSQTNKSAAIKKAALGGEQTAGFEQSFASLAYTYIQDKAPGLLNSMVGFQLVDRNDDNTRAVGIFGFELGDQWLYAPVFFLNGDLKGHELLYVKNQDVFVPLKENWINYLMNSRPNILGEGTNETTQQLGALQPDFQGLAEPPEEGSYKYSSFPVPPKLRKWAMAVMPTIASCVTKNPFKLEKYAGIDKRFDLRNVLSSDVRFAKLAYNAISKYPQIKMAMDELYGPSLLYNCLLQLKKQAEEENSILAISNTKEAAADKPKVKIVVDNDLAVTENIPGLNESEKKQLLRDGYLVQDYRTGDEVSIAYNTQIEVKLRNPDETGIYDVLLRPGVFESMLVIMYPNTGSGSMQFATIVKLDGEKGWHNTHPTNIWVREANTDGLVGKEPYQDWFEKQPTSTDLELDATYILVGRNHVGSCPFTVTQESDADTYIVYWKDYGDRTRPDYLPPLADRISSIPCSCNDKTIVFNNRKGSSFKSINGTLYAPADVAVIKIKDAPKCRKCDKTERKCTCEYFSREYRDDDTIIEPGNLADLQTQVLQKSASIKLWVDNNEVVINRKRMSKLAGLIHLIRDHGFREKVAKTMLKEAEKKFSGVKYYVKYASPWDATQGGMSPGFPEPSYATNSAYGNVPMQSPQVAFQQVQDLSASNTDPSVYDPMEGMDPASMQAAYGAQQSGQKEVFDTTMVSSMLKAVREDSLVTRYLGDLFKALDRLGRILFMFYWHSSEFADRYGKQDLPELEDTLRNAFEIMGDLVLFLKQKTIDPLGGAGDMGEPEIDSVATV